jgi:hypothetical protein
MIATYQKHSMVFILLLLPNEHSDKVYLSQFLRYLEFIIFLHGLNISHRPKAKVF